MQGYSISTVVNLKLMCWEGFTIE